MTKKIPTLLITVSLLWFRFLPQLQAVIPPPDGGYRGFNTAEGQGALLSLNTSIRRCEHSSWLVLAQEHR
jgi:hypothetical protein